MSDVYGGRNTGFIGLGGAMSWQRRMVICIAVLVFATGCATNTTETPELAAESEMDDRQYLLERIDDVSIAQIYADGFPALPLREKVLVWHLYNAALAGRDIYYDQRYAHGLEMREVLEEILTHSDRLDAETRDAIHRYTKLFWLNTGPFNNLTARKYVLDIDPAAFQVAAHAASEDGAVFPLKAGESLDDLLMRLEPMFFDESFDPIVTNKTPADGIDMLLSSSNNLYDGVSMEDVTSFDEQYPLNSRLVKREGIL